MSDSAQQVYQFFHSEQEFSDQEEPAAIATQNTSARSYETQGIVPDSIDLTVHEGEDTALLLAATVIMDMSQEHSVGIRRARAERREERQRELEERRTRAASLPPHWSSASRHEGHTFSGRMASYGPQDARSR